MKEIGDCQGWKVGVGVGNGSDPQRVQVSFWGDKNALKLTVEMVAYGCEYTKNRWVVHFQQMNCMVWIISL